MGSGEHRVEEKKTNVTQLGLPSKEPRRHYLYWSSWALQQPDYWWINVLCHTCSLFAFSGMQAGKLCLRKELLEYFKAGQKGHGR